jgi:Ca2+-binding EF-hand superfamily protein
MTPAQRVDSMFQRLDSDSDGKLSKDETSAMGQFGEMLMQADSNSDGFVEKAEATKAMAQMRRRGGGPGGPGGPGGGPGGGGPPR